MYDNETRELQRGEGQCFIQVKYLNSDDKEMIRVFETKACRNLKTIRTGCVDIKRDPEQRE